MADISSLNIQISASTSRAVTAIRNLQKELGSLNMSLNNYSDKSEYVRGLQRLAAGLTGLGDAVDFIDETKLLSIANAIGDLATKGAKLSGLNVANAFSQMGAAAQQTSERTRKAASEIAKAFDIRGKKGLDDLRASVDRFYAAAGNDRALKSASDDIEDVINSYRKYKNVVNDTYLAVRKWVSSTNVAMPKGATSEFLDEFRKIRGEIGIKHTGKGGIGFDTMLGEMNDALGTHFDTTNAVNGLRELKDYLRNGSEAQKNYEKSTRASLHTDEVWIGILDRLYESINQVKSAQQSVAVDKNGFLTGEGVDEDLLAAFNGDPIEKEAQQVQTAGQTITNTITEIKQDMVELSEYANPFQGIVDGLEALEDIHVDAEQFTGVRVLAENLGKLTGVNSEKASTSIPNIAKGLESLSGIVIPDNAAQLEAYGNAIAKFGTKAATRAQGLPWVADGLKQIASIGKFPDVTGIQELAAALAKLGGSKIQVAIENMPRLATAFVDLMGSLSNAPKVSQETIQLAQAMAQLATASKQTGQAMQQSSKGINLLRGAISAAFPTFHRARKHTFSLAAAFGKLYASYFLVIRGIKKLGSAIEYSSKLTEVQNVVTHTFGEQANLMDEFADRAIKDYGMAELAAKQFASRFQSMGTAMGITAKSIGAANDFIAKKIDTTAEDYKNLGSSMGELSINLTKLTADYASFFNLDYEDVADDMAAIFTGQTRPLRRYGLDLTNATLKEWALKNGLDADIKSMSQAEKTLLRYQYVMANSGHIMGDFVRTADTWANVIRTIGQQFQQLGKIIGEGLINTFKPFLIQFRGFMDGVLTTVEKGINGIGKLLGWQIEIPKVGILMNDEMEEYADNLDDAAGNAKKLNAQLRSIDELNNLTTSKGRGSGSEDSLWGTLSGLNDKTYDEELKFKKYESDVKSWFDFGKRIKDKIIESLKSINWTEISNKVKENAKGFSDMLLGILIPDKEGNTLGGKIGEFIAEGIDLGLDWLSTSTKSKSLWENGGKNIADFFYNFFTTIKWEELADVINNITQGVFTMLKEGVKELNKSEKRKEIAQKITEFFSSIDPETFGLIALTLNAITIARVTKWFVSDVVKTAMIEALVAKLSGQSVEVPIILRPIFKLGGLIGKLADMLFTTGAGQTMVLKVGETLDTIFAGVGSRIAAGFSAAFAALAGNRIGRGIGSITDQLWGKGDTDYYEESMGEARMWGDTFVAIKDSVTQLTFFKDLINAINETPLNVKVGETIIDWFNEFLGSGSALYQSFFGEGSPMYDISKGIDDWTYKIREKLYSLFTGHTGGGGGHSFGEDGENAGQDFVDGMDSSLEKNSSHLNSQFSLIGAGAGTGFTDGIKTAWTLFTAWWKTTGIYKWWTESVMPWFTKEKWQTLGNNIKTGLTNKWNEFADWWNNTGFKRWIDETSRKFGELYDDLCGDDGFFTKLWSKAQEVWGDIKSIFEEGIHIKLPHISWDSDNSVSAPKGIKEALDLFGLPSSIPKLKVEWYANGGFPSVGSLFVAGERGTEMLGTIGGKTAVASNGEITGISDTIRQTSSEEIALLRQQNQLLQGILQKEFGISKDSIFKSVRTSASEYTKITGNPAFA